jgi:hypothetical protein
MTSITSPIEPPSTNAGWGFEVLAGHTVRCHAVLFTFRGGAMTEVANLDELRRVEKIRRSLLTAHR